MITTADTPNEDRGDGDFRTASRRSIDRYLDAVEQAMVAAGVPRRRRAIGDDLGSEILNMPGPGKTDLAAVPMFGTLITTGSAPTRERPI